MKRQKVGLLLLELFTIALAGVVLIPFLIILVNSFKGIREAALFQLTLPKEWVFTNYVTVFRQANVLRGFKNSFLLAGSVVFFVNFLASMAAFIIQRRESRFTRWAYYTFIIGLIMPVSIVPTIKLLMDLKLHGTYFGIIMYYTGVMLPFALFLLTGFMKSIPRELDEAAIIEGAGPFRLYTHIILPLLKPALITVTIIVTISVWNDFFGPFYLVTDSRKWTIVLQIFSFVTLYSTHWGVVFAFMVIVVSPVLLIYLLLQRYIIEGLVAGSLKG